MALTWTMTDRSGILHYEIEYGTRKIKTIITIKDPSTEFTITGLQLKMTYAIRMRAVWDNGQAGNWSSSVNAHTGMLHKLGELRTQLLALL